MVLKQGFFRKDKSKAINVRTNFGNIIYIESARILLELINNCIIRFETRKCVTLNHQRQILASIGGNYHVAK